MTRPARTPGIRLEVSHETIYHYSAPVELAHHLAFLRPLEDEAQQLLDHTLRIEPGLRTLRVPTLIAWGTDDIYFDVAWSKWLADTIPGTRKRVEFDRARIFFPEERWNDFNKELRAHWLATADEGAGTSTRSGKALASA